MVLAAEDLCHRGGPASNKLFEVLYPGICLDDGAEPVGEQWHMERVYQDLLLSSAFQRKGTRVALRRWFGWVPAALEFDSTWHRRLLAILHVGMVTKVYPDFASTP
eukprot:8884545-Lingulodinium_polyedra.AAC.1